MEIERVEIPPFLLKNMFTPFKNNFNIQILTSVQALVFLTLWLFIPDSVFPSLIEILKSWNDIALNQGLLIELGKSSYTITIAIVYSTIISLLIALLSSIQIFKPVSSAISALRFLGFAGIAFMFTLLTNDGSSLKIALLTFGMTVFLSTNLISMVGSITQDQIDYAKTLKMSPIRSLYELSIREKLDEIIDLIRQNSAIAWTMLSMVEGIVRSEGGIGSLLISQNKQFHLSAVFAIQLTILIYGISQDYLLQYIKNLVCPYLKFQKVK